MGTLNPVVGQVYAGGELSFIPEFVGCFGEIKTVFTNFVKLKVEVPKAF